MGLKVSYKIVIVMVLSCSRLTKCEPIAYKAEHIEKTRRRRTKKKPKPKPEVLVFVVEEFDSTVVEPIVGGERG